MNISYLFIDTFNLFYRSYYALRDMRNSKMIPNGAFFGFCRTLKKLCAQYHPQKIIICSDTAHSLRKERYRDYKAQRGERPEELLLQQPMLFEFFSLLSLTPCTIEGYEADDIIIGLVHQIKESEPSAKIVIASSDKDLHSLLLLEQVFLYDFSKNTLLDRAWVENTYGALATKERILLYYALIGDASDNIPGVAGIGKKGASLITQTYESLSSLYATYLNDATLPASLKKKLTAGKESALLSEQLLLPLAIEKEVKEHCINESTPWSIDRWRNANTLFTSLECYSLIMDKEHKEVEAGEPAAVFVQHQFKTRVYEEAFHAMLLEKIAEHGVVAIDTETTGGNPRTESEILAYSFCFDPEESWYVPLFSLGTRCADFEIKKELLDTLMKQASKIIMHNALYDLHIIARVGIKNSTPVFDTMVAAHSIYGSSFKIGLKDLSLRLFKEKMQSFSEVIQRGKYHRFDYIPLEEASPYAAADARQTLKLYQFFTNQFGKEPIYQLLTEVEMPLIPVLHAIETKGIFIEQKKLKKTGELIKRTLQTLQKEITALLPDGERCFNPLSWQQTAHCLSEVFHITLEKKTEKTKQKSTDALSLSQVQNKHPIVSLIIKFRTLHAMYSRCIVGLEKYITEAHRIQVSFDQTATTTGRLATHTPNLQNIPRTGEDFAIRHAFTAPKGYVLISFDYSQIELRVLAAFSGDRALINAFINNEDVHTITAQSLFNKESVTDEERQIAKKINFSVIYGGSAYSIARELHIPRREAESYLEKYRAHYATVFSWKETIKQKAIEDGSVTTAGGRKRIIPELKDRSSEVRNYGVRMAINTIIQGTAAEIMKRSMIAMDHYLNHCNCHAAIVLQIHDELLIEAEKTQSEKIFSEGKMIMESPTAVGSPLPFQWDNFLIAKGYCATTWQ